MTQEYNFSEREMKYLQEVGKYIGLPFNPVDRNDDPLKWNENDVINQSIITEWVMCKNDFKTPIDVSPKSTVSARETFMIEMANNMVNYQGPTLIDIRNEHPASDYVNAIIKKECNTRGVDLNDDNVVCEIIDSFDDKSFTHIMNIANILINYAPDVDEYDHYVLHDDERRLDWELKQKNIREQMAKIENQDDFHKELSNRMLDCPATTPKMAIRIATEAFVHLALSPTEYGFENTKQALDSISDEQSIHKAINNSPTYNLWCMDSYRSGVAVLPEYGEQVFTPQKILRTIDFIHSEAVQIGKNIVEQHLKNELIPEITPRQRQQNKHTL